MDIKAKINVISDSVNENYTLSKSFNFVRNTGVSFMDAIFKVYTKKTDTLYAKITIYDKDGNIVKEAVQEAEPRSGEENSICARCDLYGLEGEYTAETALYIKASNEAVSSTVSRTLNLKGSYADTERVTLKEGSVLKESEAVGFDYINSIDVDRLLAPSFEVQGLSTPNGKARYGGWERKGASNWGSSASTFTLAGHSLGHWMSAAAVFYRDTNNQSILEKLNYVVDQLDYIQTTNNTGYIGGCEEGCFTALFGGNVSSWSNNYWVPWYGVHKIYQGLLDAYDYTGNEKAFTVLKKFSDWALEGLSNLSDSQMQTMLNVEYGGMNEIFARMYEITGEEKYLVCAKRFTHDSILTPLISNTDSLAGLHANTQIPKIVGAAEIYEQDPVKYADYRKGAENFWSIVNNTRAYAIGGNSIAEHFEAKGAETLGVKTCESCNTYNMMRLTEHLFSWNTDNAAKCAEYMDWYEKALYNHILGQQDPQTGEKMYFVSLLQGHHRVYEIKESSWWCCTGTGMENPGRYTRTAYFEKGDDLLVNLYMAGEYTWKAKGLTFKIETEYPYSEKVKITVTKGGADANLKFRAPSWLESEMTVTVNGEKKASSLGGTYAAVSGSWNMGDVIEITIPMSLRTYKSRTEGQVAFEYGPIVLAADLGICTGVSGVTENNTDETKIDTVTAKVPYIETYGAEPETLVSAVDTSKLEFKIGAENSSDGNEIHLKPFYEIHHSFHSVYFNLDEAGDEYDKWLNDIQIDSVEPDGQQDELGHNLQKNYSNSSTTHQGSLTIGSKTYYRRDAWGSTDDYFSYNLAIDGERQNYLFVRYYGSDTPFKNGGVTYTRDFNIYIDGALLSDQQINNNNPGGVYDVFYKIPVEMTAGKTGVAVKFMPKNASTCAGGVLNVRTTTTDTQDTAPKAEITSEGNLV